MGKGKSARRSVFRVLHEEGTGVLIEERGDGLLIRPAAAVPLEVYSPERKAELTLNNAVDEADYRRACEEVRRMGIDPAQTSVLTPRRLLLLHPDDAARDRGERNGDGSSVR